MLWQENIPYIFSILILANSISMILGLSTTKTNTSIWESKSISKIMEIYMLSPTYFSTLIFCRCIQLPFYKLLFSLHLKITPVGNILPHIFSLSNLLKTIKLWVEIFFKTSSCHNWVWSFLQDSIVNYGNGGMINSCGLICVVISVMLILLCLLLVRINSSIMLNTKIKQTWPQIWNVTWI